MKCLLPLLVVVMMSIASSAQKYNVFNAHDDSVLIYQTYKNEIAFMELAAKDLNKKAWDARTAVDDTLTGGAKRRLERWNHTPYESIDTKDMEGVGTAYLYPEPGEMRKPKFSVIDPQVKFLTGPNGKTKSAYMEKIYFDEGGVAINTEKVLIEDQRRD